MATKDHKRRAKPIPQARVYGDADSLTIVVPDVLGKNAAHKQGNGGARHVSAQTKHFRESVRAGVHFARVTAPARSLLNGDAPHNVALPMIRVDAWRLEVVGVWPTRRHAIDGRPLEFVVPMGDSDAPVSQALDALKHGLVVDDDGRFVEVRGWSVYRKGVRCTVIRLIRVRDLAESDAAIDDLLALAPEVEAPTRRREKATPEAKSIARDLRRKRVPGLSVTTDGARVVLTAKE